MKILGQGKRLRLVQSSQWEYVERKNATGVALIVATVEDRLILVEQWRRSVNKSVLEIPAGLVGDEDKGESLKTAAKRELFEETGYVARSLTCLTWGPPSVGLSNEIVHFFWASGLTKKGPGGGDHNENIKVHEVELGKLESFLKSALKKGKLVDPKIYLAAYFAHRMG